MNKKYDKELLLNKEYELNNLTDNQLNSIAKFLAQNELIKSKYVSKEFYDTLYK